MGDEQSDSGGVPCLIFEFQRLKGDCISFINTYNLSAQYIENSARPIENSSNIIHIGCLSLPTVAIDVKVDVSFAPLLDLVGAADAAHLQAESAALLADVSRDGIVAASLCSARNVACFKQLLDSCQLEIAYPAALVLRNLIEQPGAGPCFTNQDLLLSIAEKVTQCHVAVLVQRVLAEVLSIAGRCCENVISEECCNTVLHALEEAVP